MSKFSQPKPILSKDYLIKESKAIFSSKYVNSKADRLKKLFTLMKKAKSRLKDMEFSGQQEDANEFLQTLLDIYYDENPPIRLNSKIEPKNQNSGVKNKKPKIDPATTLELEIGSTNKISECLGFYSRHEDKPDIRFVSGTGEELQTENGDISLEATKTITPILQQNVDEFCLSLKRFYRSNNATLRIENDVSVDEIELDVASEEGQTIKQKFTPTAIISHLGNSANSGHYIAFVKELDIRDSKVKWFCYNDSSTKTEATKDQMEGIKKSCYVVKYSKIHEDGVNLPKSSQNTVGIRNLGNTCWANSTMALFSSMVNEKTKFRDFYTSYEHNNSTTQDITPEISVQQASKEDLNKELLALVSSNEETSEILEKKEELSHSSSKNKFLSPISSPTPETEKESKRIENFDLNFDLKTKKEIIPSISIKVTSYEPLMLNEKNIWQQKVAGSEDFISNNRKNNYRVMNGVYEENDEFSEAKVHEVFKQIIADGAKKYQLSSEEVLQIITHAKAKGGVNNNINIDDGKYLENVALESGKISENAQKNAKSFSGYFQKQCEECGIYTGRTGDNVRSVGLRLTFIPDEIVDGLKLEGKSTAQISEQEFVGENEFNETKAKVMSLLPQHSR